MRNGQRPKRLHRRFAFPNRLGEPKEIHATLSGTLCSTYYVGPMRSYVCGLRGVGHVIVVGFARSEKRAEGRAQHGVDVFGSKNGDRLREKIDIASTTRRFL